MQNTACVAFVTYSCQCHTTYSYQCHSTTSSHIRINAFRLEKPLRKELAATARYFCAIWSFCCSPTRSSVKGFLAQCHVGLGRGFVLSDAKGDAESARRRRFCLRWRAARVTRAGEDAQEQGRRCPDSEAVAAEAAAGAETAGAGRAAERLGQGLPGICNREEEVFLSPLGRSFRAHAN